MDGLMSAPSGGGGGLFGAEEEEPAVKATSTKEKQKSLFDD